MFNWKLDFQLGNGSDSQITDLSVSDHCLPKGRHSEAAMKKGSFVPKNVPGVGWGGVGWGGVRWGGVGWGEVRWGGVGRGGVRWGGVGWGGVGWGGVGWSGVGWVM